MHSAKRFVWAAMLFTALFLGAPVYGSVIDDTEPEVTDRVARISFIRGDVQIRRADTDQWEKAVLNLPIVEGDEITTGGDSRFEIQFGTTSHLRVSENAYLKIASLKDGAIAVSLPQGSLSLSSAKFDSDSESFEIDAPRTTFAVLKAGRYRVDSGKVGDQEIRVSVAESGEARVYSNNAGFTLRDGRSARLYVEGNMAGEWETGDTARFTDEFDNWALDRDAMIAKRLNDANYDTYYDRDIYGADELNDNGDWVHTVDYGYVWRPSRRSISHYVDWSPYRYGHWRWVPGYAWTWVNDEPWGWATYHHGRWIWYNGSWHWSPYGYYRHRRSWWYPALVVLRVINRSVCWYPLPYHYGYYNYNRHYYSGHPRRRQPRTSPSPRPQPFEPSPPNREWKIGRSAPPDTGVISVPLDDFGRGTGAYVKPPRSVARDIIAKAPDDNDDGPRLPIMRDIGNKVGRDVRSDTPRQVPASVGVKIGAARRDPDTPLDKGLRDTIVRGNRPAVKPRIDPVELGPPQREPSIPPTGAVERPVTKPVDRIREPQRPTGDEVRKAIPREAPPKQDVPQRGLPRVEQPVQKEQPRYDPPKREVPPRSDPPKRSDPPPQKEQPRETPKSDPPKRSDPPPQKSEPTKPSEGSKARSKNGR